MTEKEIRGCAKECQKVWSAEEKVAIIRKWHEPCETERDEESKELAEAVLDNESLRTALKALCDKLDASNWPFTHLTIQEEYTAAHELLERLDAQQAPKGR